MTDLQSGFSNLIFQVENILSLSLQFNQEMKWVVVVATHRFAAAIENKQQQHNPGEPGGWQI